MESTSQSPRHEDGVIIWANDMFAVPVEESLRLYNSLPAAMRYYLDSIYDIDPLVAEEFRYALTDSSEPLDHQEARQAMIDFLNENDERLPA